MAKIKEEEDMQRCLWVPLKEQVVNIFSLAKFYELDKVKPPNQP